MPDAYEVHDGQFCQNKISPPSSAGGLFAVIGPVPAGRVWTILSAFVTCSVAETQVYWFAIYGVSDYFPITAPASISVAPAVLQYYPCLREGMEIKLFAGEFLYAFRAAATALSTITLSARIIETDQPFYQEPDKYKVARRPKGAVLELQKILRGRAAAGGSAGSGDYSAPTGPGRGEQKR